MEKTNINHLGRNRNVADYAMAFDLIMSLTSAISEADAIDEIIDLLIGLCAPSSIIYVSIVDSKPSKVKYFPESNDLPLKFDDGLINIKNDYEWTQSGCGLRLRIKHRDELIGYVEIEGFSFPEYKNHYLNLILSLVKVFALAIDNARKYQKLMDMNENLENKIEEGIRKHELQEHMLVQQSKMAAMGEIIGMIAHQWKQPLNIIGTTVQDVVDSYDYDELDRKSLENVRKEVMNQVNFMSNTINDFMRFFRPSKEKSMFDIISVVNDMIMMFEPYFIKYRIRLIKNIGDCCKQYIVSGYPNEFKQVLLNLINNSRDAILSRRQKGIGQKCIEEIDDKIAFNVFEEEKGTIILSIQDTGGGIPLDIIDRIFEPYFTTKDGDKGTGIGLYMSKVIIENNMGWKLAVKNAEEGAEFRIEMGEV